MLKPRRPSPAPLSLSSNFFLAKIDAALGSGRYSWHEVWADSTGTVVDKTGGRYGASANPGYSVTGATFSASEVVLVRSADGAGGTIWELSKLPGTTSVTGTGTDNRAVRWDGTGTPTIQDSTVVISDAGEVQAHYLVLSNSPAGSYHSHFAPYAANYIGLFQTQFRHQGDVADGSLAVKELGATTVISGSYQAGANVGGTVTTGGLTFISGLYISGTLTAGTVTSITAGAGLTGGTITTTGTIAVDSGTSGHKIPYLDGANTWSALQTVTVTDAVTNAASDVLVLDHESSGTPASPFAADLRFKLKDSTTSSQDAGIVRCVWVDATHASRQGMIQLYAYDTTGARQLLAAGANGSAATIGFLGATASARLASPDLGTLATTFGLASGTPTFGVANLTGTTLPASVVTSSLTSVGTIGTGTWQGSIVGIAYGGTGISFGAIPNDGTFYYADSISGLLKTLAPNTTGTKKFLQMTSSVPSWGALVAADYPVFVAAGGSHAQGAVPDPGATAYSNFPHILGSDAAWRKHYGELIGVNSTATSETTTSTSATDLTTTQSVTFSLDETSDVLVVISCTHSNTGANTDRAYVTVDGSATAVIRQVVTAGNNFNSCGQYLATGLSSGSHTIKMQFSVTAGTGTFADRVMTIWRGTT